MEIQPGSESDPIPIQVAQMEEETGAVENAKQVIIFEYNQETDPQDNLYHLYEHPQWFRRQLTEVIQRHAAGDSLKNISQIQIGKHKLYVADLIDFCLSLDTISLIETDIKRVIEHPELLRGRVKELYNLIGLSSGSENESRHAKRILSMIMALTTKANQGIETGEAVDDQWELENTESA